MASIDTSLVDGEFRAIVRTSQGIKKRLRSVMGDIESDPGSFDELKDVPNDIHELPNVVLRKAKITQGPHDFRLIFSHWTFDDGTEHVDMLMAFPRKEGGHIDWPWILDHLAREDD